MYVTDNKIMSAFPLQKPCTAFLGCRNAKVTEQVVKRKTGKIKWWSPRNKREEDIETKIGSHMQTVMHEYPLWRVTADSCLIVGHFWIYRSLINLSSFCYIYTWTTWLSLDFGGINIVICNVCRTLTPVYVHWLFFLWQKQTYFLNMFFSSSQLFTKKENGMDIFYKPPPGAQSVLRE